MIVITKSADRHLAMKWVVLLGLLLMLLAGALQTTHAQTPDSPAPTSTSSLDSVQTTATALAMDSQPESLDDLVLFLSKRENGWQSYVIKPGETEQLITANWDEMSGYEAVFSPDRTMIVFIHTPEGAESESIFVTNTDGTDISLVVEDLGRDVYVTWLPNGRQLAFTSSRDGNIYVTTLDSREITLLTNEGSYNNYPLWSPDGTKVAFISDRDGNHDLYVMNADGSNIEKITSQEGIGFRVRFDWSPDSQSLVFSSTRDGESNLYTVLLSSGAVKRITTQEGKNDDPSWSPDGTKIAFINTLAKVGSLYTVNVDGSDLRPMNTDETLNFMCPRWMPDSQRIVVTADPIENKYMPSEVQNIYVAYMDGRDMLSLTTDETVDMLPHCLSSLFG